MQNIILFSIKEISRILFFSIPIIDDVYLTVVYKVLFCGLLRMLFIQSWPRVNNIYQTAFVR